MAHLWSEDSQAAASDVWQEAQVAVPTYVGAGVEQPSSDNESDSTIVRVMPANEIPAGRLLDRYCHTKETLITLIRGI